MSVSMKIPPAGDELFHADRQTDMTKLLVAFRNFAKAPKNQNHIFLQRINGKKFGNLHIT
jgi:hypothetical protein